VVGHSNHRVVEAMSRQAAVLNTNTRYLHESVLQLADRLIASMPQGLDTVMFVNSGSEANDLAWRLATAATGGTGGVVTEFAYHGMSSAVADLSPEGWPRNYAPDHVALLPAPDAYRGLYRRDSPGWSSKYARHMDDAIAQLRLRGHRPAALLIDAGFTSDGILTPPSEYLLDLTQRWQRAGGLFVADEVQVGFGRCGSHLWSFQVYGVTPDIVTIGKPMGNGHPVAAVVTRSEIVDTFAMRNSWLSTFGGNPVACEATLAVLDVIEELDLLAHTESVAALLAARLQEIQSRHGVIGDVRSRGLLVGVELVQDRSSRDPLPADGLANALRERGVLVGTTGPHANIFKIRPPLVIGPEEVGLLADTLDRALTEMAH
jgi:4-aminobutyrate aminotransferase-like enzyme